MNYYGKDWRGSRWVKFDWEAHSDHIPPLPACYVVYVDGFVAYIGQTYDLRTRLKNYKFSGAEYRGLFNTPWGCGHNLIVKARFGDRHGDWAMRELRLLKRLKPPGNKVMVMPAKPRTNHVASRYLRRGVFRA